MIILEEGKDDVVKIVRQSFKEDGYWKDTSEVNSVYINTFDSIDSDSWSIKIIVSTRIMYSISIKCDHKIFLDKLLKSEIRDQKINSILS